MKISPAGLAVDERRGLLYVVTKEDNGLYVLDMVNHGVARRLPMSGEGYTCLAGAFGGGVVCERVGWG
ncbi:hypothetical protein ACQ86N_26795 [Puia sp. P3]|uniref:hypothetical protein n=1 Tax=Puia sp. P3 TaxID=3423952 RepID=UPI003D67FE3A